MERFRMNDKEITKEYWMKKILNKETTIKIAAESLGLSTRQVKRIKKGYKEKGVESIIHGNLNRRPKHAIPVETKKRIIELKTSEKYSEANISHFYDLIKEDEMKETKIEYVTVYKILSKAGIKSNRKHRKVKQHHRRKRLETFGKMLQIDATPYDWFGVGKRYNIHGAIDDATGRITGLYMTENESLDGYFNMMERTFKNYGRPVSIYSDRHLILHPKEKLTIEEQLEGKPQKESHFSRAMRELNIEMIRAYSPQAKGRIERLWGTLQSRLPVEFKIKGIKTIEEANKYLEGYIKKYNKRFEIKCDTIENVFRKIPEEIELKYCLCRKESRKLNSGGIIHIANKVFKVLTTEIPYSAIVTVLIGKKIGIKVKYKDKYYKTELFEDRAEEVQYDILAVVVKKMLSESLKEASGF
jgi:transposase